MADSAFLGKFEHVLDAKGRLAVPARFRDGLATGSVITRGAERCLVMYPAAAWDRLRQLVSGLPISDPNARSFRRFLFAEAAPIELDGQGRLLIPSALRTYSMLERTAVFVGMDTSVEIWSESNWNEIASTLEFSAATMLEHLQSVI